MNTALLVTHLWQSTLCIGAAALITVMLRANQARLRYVVWLTASVKFLVPFSALVAFGQLFSWRTTAVAHPVLTAVETLATPFTTSFALSGPESVAFSIEQRDAAVSWPAAFAAVWALGTVVLLVVWFTRWRTLRTLRSEAVIATSGREFDILRRVAGISGARDLPLLLSAGSLEPGVVGAWRPVILWPSNISRHMSDDQIEAILLHELAHVRRHDNLLALAHMTVQALFWFHPAVWWIGARLMDERERACDEDVVRLGADPRQYAEGILRTCEYAVESPLVCVAGVTGADLKRRIGAIVRNRPAARLGAMKTVLLTAIALFLAVGPIMAGALTITAAEEATARLVRFSIRRASPGLQPDFLRRLGGDAPRREIERGFLTIVGRRSLQVSPPSALPMFEVASIKPTTASNLALVELLPGGRFRATNFPLQTLIARAWQVQSNQVDGGPSWIRSDGFDIDARVGASGVDVPRDQMWLMLRTLLTDRFNLRLQPETRELPVYELSLARPDGKLGPALRPFSDSSCERRAVGGPMVAPVTTDRPPCGVLYSPAGRWIGRETTIDSLSSALTRVMGRVVLNRTGLTGKFDLDLEWTDMAQLLNPSLASPPPAGGPSLQTALVEQLGLKIESKKGPVDVLIVQQVDRPTPN